MAQVIESRPVIDGEQFSRVDFTAQCVQLLRRLWDLHGPLMFHQSGGCCDGSSPMCYPAGEFKTGNATSCWGCWRCLLRTGPCWETSIFGCQGNSSNTGSTPG